MSKEDQMAAHPWKCLPDDQLKAAIKEADAKVSELSKELASWKWFRFGCMKEEIERRSKSNE